MSRLRAFDPSQLRTHRRRWLASSILAGSITLALASGAQALPAGGEVVAGTATVTGGPGVLTINQSSQNAAINWQSFSIGSGEAVQFVQPGSSSVALNRVLGTDPSNILGRLSANGHVFLVNPNGVLFGGGAQVNVGGLVASTIGIDTADFMAGDYRFAGSGPGSVINQGSIVADGGSVALLGARVSNQGIISARLGAVTLAAGSGMTLDVAGDGLLNVRVDEGALNALAENGGLIRADGGRVLMTARSAGALLRSAVNNTGVIQARTVENRAGTIMLMGDMDSGDANIAGTLDASAPDGGDGGFIETSASNVRINDGAQITTLAPLGETGQWLIDPNDFVIAPLGGNISGATLGGLLTTSSVIITTAGGSDSDVVGPPAVKTRTSNGGGTGKITVNDAVTWVASGAVTTLSLIAAGEVVVNFDISATEGNLIICCGLDVTLKSAITTVRGSVLISSGGDVNFNSVAVITTTDGNITICAANDINFDGTMTLTRGTSLPARSLNLGLG